MVADFTLYSMWSQFWCRDKIVKFVFIIANVFLHTQAEIRAMYDYKINRLNSYLLCWLGLINDYDDLDFLSF